MSEEIIESKEDVEKYLSNYKKFTTLCVFIIVCLTIVACDSYIGKVNVISESRNTISSIQDNTCNNFNLLYRPVNETCFECFYPTNDTGKLTNNVFRICSSGTYPSSGIGDIRREWNKSIKYIETP